MAIRQDISLESYFFIGTLQPIEFEVLQSIPGVKVAELPPRDVTGWTDLIWQCRSKVGASSALITKSSSSGIAIVGTYDAVRANNTQRVVVTVEAPDTAALAPGFFAHALKRTTAGGEEVLVFGDCVLRQSAAH